MAERGEDLDFRNGLESTQKPSPLKESFVGNVSKCSALPPDYSSSAKKGNLQFDASFEGGNLGRVDYVTDYEYDLFIRPDTCNPRFRVWFNFTVQNVVSDQVLSHDCGQWEGLGIMLGLRKGLIYVYGKLFFKHEEFST